MTEEKANVELSVRYKDMETRFTGRPNEVIRSFLGFMSQIFPAYDLVSGLTLTVDLENLLKNIEGLIAFTPEGPALTIQKESLSGERDAIVLYLIMAYVGYQTGQTKEESLTTSEIISLTGGKSSAVGARLSELTSMGWIQRISRGEYKMTTLGVKAFLDEMLPRIRPRGDP